VSVFVCVCVCVCVWACVCVHTHIGDILRETSGFSISPKKSPTPYLFTSTCVFLCPESYEEEDPCVFKKWVVLGY